MCSRDTIPEPAPDGPERTPFRWEDGTESASVTDDGYGGEVELSLSCDSGYTVQEDADWITVETRYGGVLTLKLDENRGLESREAQIKISEIDTGESLTCTVSQTYTDKAVLIRLYDALDGDNWGDKRCWKSDSPIREWYGVSTGENGRVTHLQLENNHLRGELPDEIHLLNELQTLELYSLKHTNTLDNSQKDLWNEITGTFHASSFPHLKTIWLAGCVGLGGDIEEFWSLAEVEKILLDNCCFAGAITPEIVNLTHLTHLHLDSNNLSGKIPDEITRMTWLKGLRLGNSYKKSYTSPYYVEPCNVFEGGLPESLGDMKSLEYLDLNFAGLTGAFPESFYSLPSLRSCSIIYNAFSGTLDGTELSSMPSMSSFLIYNNPGLFITGEIPSWVSCFSNQIR